MINWRTWVGWHLAETRNVPVTFTLTVRCGLQDENAKASSGAGAVKLALRNVPRPGSRQREKNENQRLTTRISSNSGQDEDDVVNRPASRPEQHSHPSLLELFNLSVNLYHGPMAFNSPGFAEPFAQDIQRLFLPPFLFPSLLSSHDLAFFRIFVQSERVARFDVL